MLRLIAACVALGALSSLLPSEPSYDPWAWLVWAPRPRSRSGHKRERLAGEVLVWGRARERVQVARAGAFRVYRREGLSYRLFTSRLQGFHIRAGNGNELPDRVVTR